MNSKKLAVSGAVILAVFCIAKAAWGVTADLPIYGSWSFPPEVHNGVKQSLTITISPQLITYHVRCSEGDIRTDVAQSAPASVTDDSFTIYDFSARTLYNCGVEIDAGNYPYLISGAQKDHILLPATAEHGSRAGVRWTPAMDYLK